MFKKSLKVVLFSLTTFALVACGNSNAAEGEDSAKNIETVTVATNGATKPFTYVDSETDELTGYDIEVLESVFENLPQYDLNFEITEFETVLGGLDTNRYQIGANNFSMTEERQEKYKFSKPYYRNSYDIVLPKGTTGVEGLADLTGQKTPATPGSNQVTALEDFNKKNPDNAVSIQFTDGNTTQWIQDVANGRYDFYVSSAGIARDVVDEFDLPLDLVPLSQAENEYFLTNPYSYFLFSNTTENEKLIEDFNAELENLVEDGTISEISEKYFKSDLSPSLKEFQAE